MPIASSGGMRLHNSILFKHIDDKFEENLNQPHTKYHVPSPHYVCPFPSLENPKIIRSIRKLTKVFLCCFLSYSDALIGLEAC